MGNRHSKKNNQVCVSNYHEVFVRKPDNDHHEKEHLGHSLIREIFEGNFSSPIQDALLNKKSKVLDMGCGSGFWLMEMAADFPEPNYIGIDMLPVFPKSTYPSNVQFVRCNFLEGLPFRNDTFDFIHVQCLACDFTESQWENFVYQELERVLKPGGWLEVCDPEFQFTNHGPLSKRLNVAVNKYLKTKHVNPYMTKRHRSLIKSIPSFSSVHHEECFLPLSSRTKLGMSGGHHVKEACRGILQGPVGQNMKIKRKNVNLFLDKMASEFVSYGSYLNFHRFYVQKESSYKQ